MKSLKKYKSVFELINNFPNEEDCINYLESIYWPNKIISPFDINSDIYKLSEPHTYMCKNTQKKFNIKTNTVFSKTRLSLRKWFICIYLYFSEQDKESKTSILRISKFLAITYKSAYLLTKKIKNDEESCKIIYEGGVTTNINPNIWKIIYSYFANILCFNKKQNFEKEINENQNTNTSNFKSSISNSKMKTYYIYDLINPNNNEVVFVILSNILEINKINGLIKSMCSNVNYNNPLLKDFVNKNKNNLIIKKFSSFRTREYKNAYSKKKKHIKDLIKLGYVILNKD